MSKWTCEVTKNLVGTYSANMYIDGKYVEGLPKHVKYTVLRDAIKERTGIEILLKKDMKFELFNNGNVKKATIDNTQERADCRVRRQEIYDGWKPCWD